MVDPQLITAGASLLTELGGKALTKREQSTNAQDLRASAKSAGLAVKKACGKRPKFSLLNKKKIAAWNLCQENFSKTEQTKEKSKANIQIAKSKQAIEDNKQAQTAAQAKADAENKKTKFNRNLIIGSSIVGGLLLIVGTIFLIKKNKGK